MSTEVKIECGCGTRYKFDAEPVNGQLPYTIQCPNCNADGTAAANEYLRLVSPPSIPPAQSQAPESAPVQPRAPEPQTARRSSPPPFRAAPAAPGAKQRAYGEPNIMMGTVGAAAGAFVGMLVWFALIKFAHLELGIIAWGVGIATGFACRTLGAGYSQKLGIIAGAFAFVAIVGGEFLATKSYFNQLMEKMVVGAYDNRMAYAKKAVEAKNDQEIRTLLAAQQSEEGDQVTPDSIKDSDLDEFRKELPKLQDFVKGKPGRTQFDQELRASLNSTEMNSLLLRHSVSLWTLLWLFFGVGSAYKLGSGVTE